MSVELRKMSAIVVIDVLVPPSECFIPVWKDIRVELREVPAIVLIVGTASL